MIGIQPRNRFINDKPIDGRLWMILHSGLSLIMIPLLWLPASRIVAAVGLIVFGFVSFSVLYLLYGRRNFRLADAVTLLRLLSSVTILGSCLLVPSAAGSPAAFIILTAAELTDLVDGMIARRQGTTHFGARWDMEIDAFFMLLLCGTAVACYRFSPWVLLIAGMRYAFFFIFLPLPDLPASPPAFRWTAKTVCAYAVCGLISITFPGIGPKAAIALNLVGLLLLSVSFGWETVLRWKLVRGAKATGGGKLQ